MRKLWIVASTLGLLAAAGWVIAMPGWEPVVAALLALASFAGIWATRASKQMGRGGSAIVAGNGTKLNVANSGKIVGGVGSTGGDGGHAIRVGPGVTVNIDNQGVIAGGDAGSKSRTDV